MNVLMANRHDRVVLIKLNRPEAKNALSSAMMKELIGHLVKQWTIDLGVGCVVITGTRRVFCGRGRYQRK